MLGTGVLQTWGKQHTGNFLLGMCEVQKIQMNQSHSDDVMNVNG